MAGEKNSLFDNLPAPTAAPQGWLGSLFGSSERRAAQPQSRGAMLGARYQGMPNTRSTVTDARSDPYSDHAAWMKNSTSPIGAYSPSISEAGSRQGWSDPMLGAGPTLSEGASDPNTYEPYKASFNQNWRPRATGPAPYNPFRISRPYGDETFGTGNMGPNLPRGGGGWDTSAGTADAVGNALPYIGAHLPIGPGDPHWTPPPSPSGPHNPQGDPARPGYDSPVLPMGVGQITPDQMQSAFQLWQGGQ